jgi:hypothetical protein
MKEPFDKKKYIPSHERPGFDEKKVKKIRPYKDGKGWDFGGDRFDRGKTGWQKPKRKR